MTLKHWAIALTIVAALSVGVSLAGKPAHISIATEEFPPYTSETLYRFGVDAHIVSEAFRAVDIEVEYTFLPGARSYKSAETGEHDATLPWSYRSGREKYFYYPEPVITIEGTSFFHDGDLTFDWNPEQPSYADLRGRHFAAQIGFNYGPLFENAEKSGVIDVIRLPSIDQAFRMLERGRVDFVVSDRNVGFFELSRLFQPETVQRFTTTPQRSDAVEVQYLLISQASDQAAFFLTAFNDGMAIIQENGVYEKILQDLEAGRYNEQQ